MEFNLRNFVVAATRLSKVDLLIIAKEHVEREHGVRLTNHFEKVVIKRCLHDTVVKLND